MRSSPEGRAVGPGRRGAPAGLGGAAGRLLPAAFLVFLLGPVLVPAVDAVHAVAGPAVPRAHSDRPPAESTGGFGEDTCAFCHLDGELNEEEGSLELLGLPEEGYEAGEEHALSVRLRHPELRRAGFQLTARFASGEREGDQAGILLARSGQTVQEPSHRPVQYLSHDGDGVEPAAEGEGRWAVRWIAPDEPHAPVVFHLAGNAADGDGSEWGDRVFTRERELDPAN